MRKFHEYVVLLGGPDCGASMPVSPGAPDFVFPARGGTPAQRYEDSGTTTYDHANGVRRRVFIHRGVADAAKFPRP